MTQNMITDAQNTPVEEQSTNNNNVGEGVNLSELQKIIQAEIRKAVQAEARKAAKKTATAPAPAQEDDDLPADKVNDPAVQKLLQKVEKLERRNREAEAQAKEAARKAHAKEAESAIVSMLGNKVSPEIQELLVPHLMSSVKLSEDGGAVFNYNETEYDLASGVSEFLKSEKGSRYLAVKPKVTKPAPGVKPNSVAAVNTSQHQQLTIEEKALLFALENPGLEI
jgi:hypothetical protein